MVTFFNMHLDTGEGIGFLAIFMAALCSLLFSITLMVAALWIFVRARRAVGDARTDIYRRAMRLFAAGAATLGLCILTAKTDLEEHLFFWSHHADYEAVLAGHQNSIRGGSVSRWPNETVFAIPRMMTSYFIVYDHSSPSAVPQQPLPFIPERESESFWCDAHRTREQATHLGGCWYATFYDPR